MKKKKYYVVWEGRKRGLFHTWEGCCRQISGFPNAKYKSFHTKEEAENAFKNDYNKYIGKDTFKPELSKEKSQKIGLPNMKSLSVDAACNMVTGQMEYQGVITETKKVMFKQGPFKQGTNNVGEFIALVHGLAFLQSQKSDVPIYSDSRTAIAWVKKKKHKSELKKTPENAKLFDLLERAEKWLRTNVYTTTILKWETKAWGEIPADYGRK